MISVGGKNTEPYTYGDSGFNGFLSRGIGSSPGSSLRQVASSFRKVNNQQVNYDHSQQSGTLGDVIQAGQAVRIDRTGLHIFDEDNNEILLAGIIDG